MTLQKILSSAVVDSRFQLHRHSLTPLPHSPVLIDIYQNQLETDSSTTVLPFRTGVTFLIPHSDNSEQSFNNEIVYVRRGGPILEEFDIGVFHKKNKQRNFNLIHKSDQNILSKIMETIKKGRSVQIIKTEWPHGKELQVSYLADYKRWVVSDGYVSLSVIQQQNKESFSQNQNPQLIFLAKLWLQYLSTIKNIQSLKTTLSLYTLCGKVSESCKEVIWYTLVKIIQNNQNENICEDPFDAKQKIQKLGLRFIKIKSLGILNQEDQIIKNIEKAYQTVIAGFCQSKNYVYGRSRIYFVINGSYQVIGGYNLYTLEDLIFNDMRQLIMESAETTSNQFEQKLRQRVSESQSHPPYPHLYYINIFDNLKKIIKQVDSPAEIIKSKWFELIKISLFLTVKRLPISEYASYLMKNEPLIKKISSLSLQSFGPVSCKMTVIYFFVGLTGSCQTQLAQTLNKSFLSLDLHFQIIEEYGKRELKLNDVINQITAQSHYSLKHYFIKYCPRVFQIHHLQKELYNYSGNDVHYKIILITEELQKQTLIAENSYPLSYHTIINAYHQAFELIKQARKIQEKIIQLRKVTDNLVQFKNYDLLNCKNIIEVKIDSQSQSLQAKNSIQKILDSHKDDQKCYYPLLVFLERYHKLQDVWDLSRQAAKIISNSYYSIPNIALNQ